MRHAMPRVLMMLAVAAAVQSCASKDATELRLPPAADLQVQSEPAYPVKALEPCPTNLRSDPCPAEDAERGHSDATLLWGREGWRQVQRLCRWAKGLGAKVECEAR